MKIKNLGLRIKNPQKGYTLVELLTVIVIMVVVGMIVTGIIVSSLRGSNKSTVLNNVRENGNYAIIQISKMLTFAQAFNGVSTDGVTYTTVCVPAPTPLPSGSPSPLPTPTPQQFYYVKITSFDGGQTVFSCSGNPYTIASNSSSLIDTSTVSVDPTKCYFTCTGHTLTEPPTIGINFTLSQISSSSSTFISEKNATIPFSTSVTIRNNGF